MDLIRIIAVFSVLSVHFFLNTNFYQMEIDSSFFYYLAIVGRTLFMICVPLFMILTGYLMSNKTLSKKYYKGITKTLIVYFLLSFVAWLFRVYHMEQDIDLWQFVCGTLNCSIIEYSWYMEMYFGFFLMIPFLNLIYNGLKNKKEKVVLLVTFLSLTSLPSLINDIVNILPDYWIMTYPVTYYFIGAFIREFGVKIKKRYIFLTFVICLFAFGGFNFYRSCGQNFEWGSYCNWFGFENIIDTVLVFAFINNLNLEKLPLFVKKCLGKISNLALGIFLSSYIFDRIFYPYLNSNFEYFWTKSKYYFIIVPCIFICSMILSWIINFFAKIIISIFGTLFKKIFKKHS